jgi:hypothetical protein
MEAMSRKRWAVIIGYAVTMLILGIAVHVVQIMRIQAASGLGIIFAVLATPSTVVGYLLQTLFFPLFIQFSDSVAFAMFPMWLSAALNVYVVYLIVLDDHKKSAKKAAEGE